MEVEEIEDDFFEPPSKPDPAPIKPQARAGRRAGGPSIFNTDDGDSNSYQPSSQANTFSAPQTTVSGNDDEDSAEGGAYQPSGVGGGGGAGGGYQPPGGSSGYQPGGRRRRNFLLGGPQAKEAAPTSMLPADPPPAQNEPSGSQPSGYQPSSMQHTPEPADEPVEEPAAPSGGGGGGYSVSSAQPPAEEPQGYQPSMGRRGRPALAQPPPDDRPQQQQAPAQPAYAPPQQSYAPPPQPAPSQPAPVHEPAPGPAPSKPGGGFKFRFGAKAAAPVTPERQPSPPPPQPSHSYAPPSDHHHLRPPSSTTPAYTPPESREAEHPKASHMPMPMQSGPAGAGALGMRNASPGPGPAAAAAAVNMSKDSVLSDLSRISSNKGADRGGLVPKSDRLRALEEELAALGVDEKLDNAYVDDQGRDLKPKPKKKKVETEDLVARVDTRLGNNDDGNARNELLKAYQQVKRYQIENEKLKEQLDSLMHAYDEISRLKNTVAEKVQVISVLEKERGALHKLHRQYQKEKLDQDAIESQYGERVRRANEELRVAKAKVHKYKEIRSELEGSLSKAADRARQLEDKNRELRGKLANITGVDQKKVPVDPEKVKKKLAEKDEQIKKLEHEKEVLQKVADSAQKKLEARDKQRLLGRQEAEDHNSELRKQVEEKARQLKETEALLHRQQSRMQRLKLEHNKLKDLNKDRLKLEKILDEPLVDDDSAIYFSGIEPISRSSSVNSMLSIGSRSNKRPPKQPDPIRHFDTAGDRVPEMQFQSAARAQGSRGGSGAAKRWKPESPAEMAALYKKGGGGDGHDAGGPGYLSLLSPQAKSALEEARTWRSQANSSEAPLGSHRSSIVQAFPPTGSGAFNSNSAAGEGATLEPHASSARGAAKVEEGDGGFEDVDIGEEVGDDDEYGEYNDDFEDVDVDELSRRSSHASQLGEKAAEEGKGRGIPTFAKASSSKSIGATREEINKLKSRLAGDSMPPVASAKGGVGESMLGEEVEEDDIEEAKSPGGDDVEEEDMDLLLAGLTNEEGLSDKGSGLPKLPLRQDSAVKSDAASSNPSTNRSKGSQAAAKGGAAARKKKVVEKQPSSKATPRSKFGARR